MAKWIAAGRPIRSESEMFKIYRKCMSNECGHFKKNKCGLCGCNIHPSDKTLNKIAWATTECPHPNKYWSASVETKGEPNEEEIKKATKELAAEESVNNKKERKGCGCGKKKS